MHLLAIALGMMSSFTTPSLTEAYSAFSSDYPQEKVFLHMDNHTYHLGDTIWYKAYVADAQQLQPTETSRVLYVDLLTQEGIFVKRNRHKIADDGTCDGFLSLNDTIYNSGFYEVRAYTQWMTCFYDPNDSLSFWRISAKARELKIHPGLRQNDVPGLFSRVVPVYEAGSRTVVPREAVGTHTQPAYPKQPASMAFFPEGGHLVRGTRARVAFEVTDAAGRHIQPACRLQDGAGRRVGRVDSVLHQGRGVIDIAAAEWSDSLRLCFRWDGQDFSFPLPQAETSGIALSCLPTEDSLHLLLQARNTTASSLRILLLARGRILADRRTDCDGETALALPLDDCPTGVGEVVLLDSLERTLAKRLFFHVAEPDRLTQATEQEHLGYGKGLHPFQKIEASIRLPQAFCGAPRSVSVSVRDYAGETDAVSASDLRTELLLCSDIKGFVETPEYYFESDDPIRRQHLDRLMMVQGWYRYDWDDAAESTWLRKEINQAFRRLDPSLTLPIEGMITCDKPYAADGDTLARYYVRCRVYDAGTVLYDSLTEVFHLEWFRFPVPDLYGEHDVRFDVCEYLSSADSLFAPFWTQQDRPGMRYTFFLPTMLWPRPRQLHFAETDRPDMTWGTAARRPIIRYDYPALSLFPLNNAIMSESDQSAFDNFLKAAGVPLPKQTPIARVTENGGARKVANLAEYQYFYSHRYRYADYYLDVFDRERFLHPLDREPAVWGVVNFIVNEDYDFVEQEITQQRDLHYPDLPPYFESIYRGYQPKVQCYSPDYSRHPLPAEDRRTRLWWNPYAEVSPEGELRIECYNNGTATSAVVEVNGWTQDGTLYAEKFLIGNPTQPE